MVSVDVKHHVYFTHSGTHRVQELCESRGGRPGLSVPNTNSPYGLYGRKATLNSNSRVSEFRSYVKVEVAILGSPSLISLVVSVDVKQH